MKDNAIVHDIDLGVEYNLSTALIFVPCYFDRGLMILRSHYFCLVIKKK